MKKILIGLAVLFLPMSVMAIEASATVKVTPLIKTTTSWDGQPLVYPTGQAEVTGIIVEIAPGAETGWHSHPVPSFGVLLQGSLDISLKDGQVKHLRAGDALAEVVATLHNGRNVGTDPVKIMVFYAGAVGTPVTIK